MFLVKIALAQEVRRGRQPTKSAARAVLRSAARAWRDPTSILSVLVRNQAGEVLKAAIQEGDLAVTGHDLTAEWGHESLYGGKARLFTAESLQAMLLEASLAVTAERG